MRLLLIFIVVLTLPGLCFSQASDFITVKKKNNRTLKTYFPGSVISFKTTSENYVEGIVHDVRNDSVFVRAYDIRAIPNNWGVSKIDTLGIFIIPVHYKDIDQVIFQDRESFKYIRNGTIFMIGGLGYAALNLVNGKYLNQSITEPENMRSLGIALGVAGAGYIMNRLYKLNNRNGKRYRVVYVHMKDLTPRKAF